MENYQVLNTADLVTFLRLAAGLGFNQVKVQSTKQDSFYLSICCFVTKRGHLVLTFYGFWSLVLLLKVTMYNFVPFLYTYFDKRS